MEKVGANEPCPCGSGVKYKRCCGAKGGVQPKQTTPWIAAAIIVAGVAAFALWVNFGRKYDASEVAAPVVLPGQPAASTPPVLPANAAVPAGGATPSTQPAGAANPLAAGQAVSGPPYPQPPGAVPPGQIWSPEHGHWHNAQAAAGGVTVQPNAQFPSPTAKPIATADGKVWSEEHQHWHDVAKDGRISDVRVMGRPVRADGTVGIMPQPRGPVPAGKVWSPEHGHWHNLPTAGSAAPAPTPGAPAAEVPAPKPEGGR
jgi:hypothetical protein